MTTLQQNINFLSPAGFKLEVEKLPGVSFFAQECELPGITMYTVDIPTPMLDYPVPGNKLIYDIFSLKFIVDENMKNYSEVLDWLYGINNPQSLDNNYTYSAQEYYKNFGNEQSLFTSLFSDGILHILDNNNNENISFHIYDMFPVSLSGLKFETTVDTIQYITCEVKFKYTYYKKL